MKNNRIIIFVVIAVLLVGIVALVASNWQNNNKFIWSPRLQQDAKQPYDFALLQNLLKDNYKWERLNEHNLPQKFDNDADMTGKAYLFVGHYPYHNEKAAASLKRFAENGGQVLLICHEVPDSMMLSFIEEDDCQYHFVKNDQLATSEAKQINCSFLHRNFLNKEFPFSYKSGVKDTSTYFWSYIPKHYLCPPFVSLGRFENENFPNAKYVNFVRARVGKGYVYWHTNPILFTNLYLSSQNGNEAGFEYLNSVLAHMDVDTWIWDNASTRNPNPNNDRRERSFTKPKTPMEYIFAQPALTWAWLLLLTIAFLYAVFGAKRRQQAVAIVEPNRNTSLEFVSTIGRLYFQQQNHKVIFEKLMSLFRSHLRRRYGIMLRDEQLNDPEVLKHIVKRTDVNEKVIKDILDEYTRLKGKLNTKYIEMSAETLNSFYALMDKFYKAEEARKKTALKD